MELPVGKMIGFIIIISLIYGGIKLKDAIEDKKKSDSQAKPIPDTNNCASNRCSTLGQWCPPGSVGTGSGTPNGRCCAREDVKKHVYKWLPGTCKDFCNVNGENMLGDHFHVCKN